MNVSPEKIKLQFPRGKNIFYEIEKNEFLEPPQIRKGIYLHRLFLEMKKEKNHLDLTSSNRDKSIG
jgi:hypothetical protein